MGNPTLSTSTHTKPKLFNPNDYYPPFDKNATENIDGKNVRLLESLLDTEYLYPIPDKLENLAVLSPEDHRIKDAVAHNIALQLLKSLRPRWPLWLLEWVVMPDFCYLLYKEQRATEKYLRESLSSSPERKAALCRVVRSLSLERIFLLSRNALITAYNADDALNQKISALHVDKE